MRPHLRKPLVCDIGAGIMKTGWSGEVEPRKFRNRTGVNFFNKRISCRLTEMCLVQGVIYPVLGRIENWTELERVLNSTYYDEYKILPEKQPLVVAMNHLGIARPPKEKKKLCQLALETLKVPAFHLANSNTMSLYSTGRTTGVVVGIGAGVASVSPVYEGEVQDFQVSNLGFAGRKMTETMHSCLRQQEPSVTMEEAEEVKKKLCYVGLDFDDEMVKAQRAEPKVYNLPDGREVKLNEEMFRIPELLFRPTLEDSEGDIEGQYGIHRLLLDSVNKNSAWMRQMMFKNVLLAGASTMLPGLPQRLFKELTHLAQASIEIEVHTPTGRDISAFLGASVLSSMDSFKDCLITQREWKEEGYRIMHKKCF